MKSLNTYNRFLQKVNDSMKIFRQELILVFKDEGVLIFFILVPILYPLLYSWIYNNEIVKEVPAVVIDNSNTPLSREFIRKLDATQGVKIIGHANNLEEGKEAIARQKSRGIINIPKEFTTDIIHGKQTFVSIYTDMSGMLYYKSILIAATDVSLAMGADLLVKKAGNTTKREDQLTKAPLKFQDVPIFNPAVGYGSYLLPGVLVLIIQQTLLLGIGLSAGTTRENNRYRGLVPVEHHTHGIYSIIFGKGLCYFLVYSIIATWITLIVPHIFNFIQMGKANDLIGILFPYLLACIFFGMTLSTLIRYRENVILFVVFTSVPLLFLSGLLWPETSISGTWRAISCLFPSTFGVNAFVKIRSMGATLHEVKFEYIALWAQVAVYFLTSCLVYTIEIRRSKRMQKSRLQQVREENMI